MSGQPESFGVMRLPREIVFGEGQVAAVGIGRLIKNNPRPIDLDGMRHFLDAAYRGDLSAAAQ